LEVFNLIDDPEYNSVVTELTTALETKMAEIGDEPAHNCPPRLGQPV